MNDPTKIEEQVKVKLDKGLPLTPQEFGRTVRVLVKAMNALSTELADMKEKLNEVSVSRSEMGSASKRNAYKPEVRSKENE